MSHRTTLRLILGDQLNPKHSWFNTVDPAVTFVMMEVRQETDYATHHIQKVVGIFHAMRRFGRALSTAGHRVRYFRISDADNTQTIAGNLASLIEETGSTDIEYMLPDEYRLDAELLNLSEHLGVSVSKVDSEHFLFSRDAVERFFGAKKSPLMESFYRYARRTFNLLMDGDQPLGGQWNFDKNNRKKLPKNIEVPKPKVFPKDLSHLVSEVRAAGIKTIGEIEPCKFLWPTSRSESLELLEWFCAHGIRLFGSYQDASSSEHWSIFHSRLSFSLNTKMISPLEVVNATINAWRKNSDIDINQIEGFVRQIIGWREYMRGIYWQHMPTYAQQNYFSHTSKLPSWFWDGDTKMKCMQYAVRQSLQYAYAHHIQRLMLTGNFALLAGIDPDEVDAWYLGIYIDAFEWVEITNTRGMSQYADGGLTATKPYVSSANYVNKMSNYCKDCGYDFKQKTSSNACPMNSLYWHFHHRHRSRLENNPRIGMVYRTWDKFSSADQATILNRGDHILNNLDSL
ncbi:MAG: cryptochrome/photolyase family protein [Pseudomonadota bacterium]